MTNKSYGQVYDFKYKEGKEKGRTDYKNNKQKKHHLDILLLQET